MTDNSETVSVSGGDPSRLLLEAGIKHNLSNRALTAKVNLVGDRRWKNSFRTLKLAFSIPFPNRTWFGLRI
jgi:hypothetical protein